MPRHARIRPEDVLRDIERGRVSALYLLTGSEPYLVDEVVSAVREAVVEPGTAEWNEDRLHADDVRGEAVVMRCNTPPMGAQRRLVHVQGVEAWSESDRAALVAYLERPAETTVLLLTGKKLDARSKLARAAGKVGVVARFDSLRERDIPPVLDRIAAARGKRLPPEAAQMLIMRCGTHLRTLASELDKLALFVGDRGEIATRDVAEAAAGEGSANVFALCDAVGAGDAAQALSLLDAELVAGDRSGPIRVTVMLARHVRLLVQAKTAGGNLAKALGLPPFIADGYGRQARDFSLDTLYRAHGLIHGADGDLKGGSRLPPRQVAERLVLALCELRAGGSPAAGAGGRGSRPGRGAGRP